MVKKKVVIKNQVKMFRLDYLCIALILIISIALRLYKINNPIADWHSWRQADTAAVARNFVRTGFDILHPRYDDLSNVQTGIPNPEGYRFVEFPIYNGLFASLYKYFPILSLEMYGRATSIFFSLIVITIIYYFVLKEENRIAAIVSALILAVFPFFVYYSRVILPEMTALGCMMLALWLLYLWKGTKRRVASWILYGLSVFFSAIALLIKPTTIFYFAALVYIFIQKYKFDILKKIPFYVYFVISLIPLVLWRQWMAQYPEGVPLYEWLITDVNTFQGRQNIFLRPAFFRWIFFERILNLILGGYAAALLVFGVLAKPARSYFLYSLGLSSLLYLFAFQGGNVQHDYYQTLILPSIAIFTGIGASLLYSHKKLFQSLYLSMFMVSALLVFSFTMSYYRVKDYYNTSDELLSIAKVIKTITPQDARIVTDSTGDTTLIYLADRRGYPAVTEDLKGLKDKGMEYFVTLKSDVAQEVEKEFELIFSNDKVFIFKL